MNPSQSEEPEPLEIRMVSAADFDELADIRIVAMQESLERVGRFDPDRARERLRASFDPNHTHWIVLGGQRVGFFATRLAGREIWLDHLYIRPEFQSRGIGSAILATIFEMADELERPLMVGALKESRANEFYQKHGFRFSHSSEWDNYYRREVKGSPGLAG
jgi:GNAT superfamily N-acetyltransferase